MLSKALPLLLISWLSLAGAGCLTLEKPSQPEPKPLGQILNQQPSEPAIDQTQPLPANMERRSLEFADGRTINFILVKLPADEWQWSLENQPQEPKTVKRWREDLNSHLVINGSYFNESQTPTGFYQSDDQTSSIGWPDADSQKNPNSYTGSITITDGNLKLNYLPQQPGLEPSSATQAFLSFPTLLFDGQALVKEDSQKYARRTVLAQDSNNIQYIILTESGVISLYELANWLAAQPEQFNTAINLDGGPSTGLSYADQNLTLDIPSASIPNIISLKKISD
ncbi:MAG TPA: phosphodiester glycosidase family protein [bacterium]|nr:MAG: hypothetical protein BWY14_00993 [Parcubacteria group bacterium ADurb.Bin192]HPN15466.1 phosphodiester glycosidase family protein [bacterium]